MIGKNTKHGMSKHPLYRTWLAMRARCSKKDMPNYRYYGGRGITVCERWQDVRNFITDLEPSYNAHVAEHGRDNTSIDRIDVNGNYEPGNVRWATQQKQVINQRTRCDNKSGVKGVSWDKRSDKWRAQIKVNGKGRFLGLYESIEEAAQARREAEKRYFAS